MPKYTLVNARLEWSNMFDSGVTAAVYGRNLTNKLYYQGGLPSGLNSATNPAVYGMPRTYGVSLRVDF